MVALGHVEVKRAVLAVLGLGLECHLDRGLDGAGTVAGVEDPGGTSIRASGGRCEELLREDDARLMGQAQEGGVVETTKLTTDRVVDLWHGVAVDVDPQARDRIEVAVAVGVDEVHALGTVDDEGSVICPPRVLGERVPDAREIAGDKVFGRHGSILTGDDLAGDGGFRSRGRTNRTRGRSWLQREPPERESGTLGRQGRSAFTHHRREEVDMDEPSVDFAIAAWREEGLWQVETLPPRTSENLESLLNALRAQPGEGGVLGLVSVAEEFLLVIRVLGSEVRFLVSDIFAAEDWPLGLDVLDRLEMPSPEDDEGDDPQPGGDLRILADFGIGADEIEMLLEDSERWPDEVLATLATRIGFGDQFDIALEQLPD
ncbi:unannotated protein [freshwater metagenome]|uniref:Unannotated protein n=2 Tax=freshwater metagenome TaxID=449393 RepID=A0A6J7J9P4_9ZZZZ